ncbi:MAG: hydroxymethylglutaryl-CoA synthase [Thermoproteota archaeon]|nr:hydroxymethylglutaryl-CoA synthase [Thermoproteota archaeon]
MVGIVSYGVYIPRWRIKTEEIAKVWDQDADRFKEGLLVEEKSVPSLDEDTVTLAVEAARNALNRSPEVNAKEIGALYVGSESHPYAVKPTATIVAEAIDATPSLTAADMEFACKAGTAGLQACMGLVKAEYVKYGMAIGADTAQAQPSDALEYTAAAGAAAYIIGRDSVIADIEGTYSTTQDVPDFWRREGEGYPQHGGRFTGEPAYFTQVVNCTRGLMERLGTKPKDYDYAVFHQPNGKFPLRAAQILGFDKEKVMPGLIVTKIGNTYSGASLLGLASVLDQAKQGDRILVTSYGSGAGSDSFSIVVTNLIEEKRDLAPSTEFYINRKEYIDYAHYSKFKRQLRGFVN